MSSCPDTDIDPILQCLHPPQGNWHEPRKVWLICLRLGVVFITSFSQSTSTFNFFFKSHTLHNEHKSSCRIPISFGRVVSFLRVVFLAIVV